MIMCHNIEFMTYPLSFRKKVFAVKDKYTLTFEQTSVRFDIPIRTLFRWQRKLEPCTTRNKVASTITTPLSYYFELAVNCQWLLF